MFRLGTAEWIILVFVALVIVLPYWKIFAKAGFPGWLSLTMIIPGVNLLALFYLAFAKWPALGKP
jgi:nicotinamide riboside transporter PnuC